MHRIGRVGGGRGGEGEGGKFFVGAHPIINYRDHRHHGADTEHSIRSFPLCTVTQSMCALPAGIAAAAGCRILGLFDDGGTVNRSVGGCEEQEQEQVLGVRPPPRAAAMAYEEEAYPIFRTDSGRCSDLATMPTTTMTATKTEVIPEIVRTWRRRRDPLLHRQHRPQHQLPRRYCRGVVILFQMVGWSGRVGTTMTTIWHHNPFPFW